MRPPWVYVVSGAMFVLAALLFWSAWKIMRDDADEDLSDDAIDLRDDDR